MLETYFTNRETVKAKFESAFKDTFEDIDEFMEDDYDFTATISALLEDFEIDEIVNKLSSKGLSVVFVIENDQDAEIYEENSVFKIDFSKEGQISDNFVSYFNKRARIAEGSYDLAIFDLWYL